MKALATLVALAALTLAGCGEPADPGAPPMEDGKYVIRLNGNMFSPMNATVPVGSTVAWVGEVGVHDVTEGRPGEEPAWSSDEQFPRKIRQGERYERTFDEAGTVHYRCVVHESSGMVATLVVE